MKNNAIPKRSDIDAKYKWAIGDLYENDNLWEEDVKKFEADMEAILLYKDHLADGGEGLYKGLQMNDRLNMMLEKIYVYANQKLHEDTTDPKYQTLSAKAQNLSIRYQAVSSFIEPEILSVTMDRFKEMLMEYPSLMKYKQYMEDILRQKKHILPKEMEELLANVYQIAKGPEKIFTMFNNADIKFPVIETDKGETIAISHGRFLSLMESKDRDIRRKTFQGLYHTYEKSENTLACIFNYNVKQATFFARSRHYNSNMEMYLDSSNIPTAVYDNLLQTVGDHLPMLHKYMKLRKRLLGYEELHMYDLYVPVIERGDREYTYEEAKELVLKGLGKMGRDYLKALEEGFQNRWIDVYENEGKRSGAYSWGAYGVHPYVLLNYQKNLKSVFTLAHEMGHALHSYYSDKYQDYLYAGYRIFVAEVASTCNESLLIHYMLQNARDKNEKLYLLNYFLEQFRGTFFRQTMFAEFEKIVHTMSQQGEELTLTALKDVYRDLNRKYYGDEVVIDEEIALEWARIPHFYNPFYVYQYATGFAAAIALSKQIRSKGQAAVNDYMKFLSGGSSRYPIELLKMAGVDMTQKEPIVSAITLFGELLDEFMKLLA